MPQTTSKKLDYDDYNVAIVCALEVEMSAVRYMFDEEHTRLPSKEGDPNRYIYGQMSNHNVVVSYLPQGGQGIGAAAAVATHIERTFPRMALRLLVGIGGGVPSATNDIRLGDVVIGMPSGVYGGVVQYDLGKETAAGFVRKGFLNAPPTSLCNAVVEMQSDHRTQSSRITDFVDRMTTKYPKLNNYRRPPAETDVLFVPANQHIHGRLTCQDCDYTQTVKRKSRRFGDTVAIFCGLIASGNRVQKDAILRDKISRDLGEILCFEMEAAGLMNIFPCIVIRGISDYADSHKNDDWHAYAAAVAAGCAKELLTYISPITSSNNSNKNVHWTITQPSNPCFTGRASIIDEIIETVQHALRSENGAGQCCVVITGMGGQGKSEICLHVASRLRASFWGVFWIDVNTVASAESGFSAIASRLKLSSSSIDDVRQSLANIDQKWLLILDNADDEDTNYQQYFPIGQKGVIILTSRNTECSFYATKNVALQGLPQDEAQELLLRVAQIRSPLADANQEDVSLIANTFLDGHPLALVQAGAYISQHHCSLKEYSSIFRTQRRGLLTFRPKQARSKHGDVYATFEASADALSSMHSQAATDALQLLSILAILAPSWVPLALFREAWQGARTIIQRNIKNCPVHRKMYKRHLSVNLLHVSNLPGFIGAYIHAWDQFNLSEAVRLLAAYSIVTVDGSGHQLSIAVHPLIHAWAKDRQNVQQQQQSWLRAACVIAISGQDKLFWYTSQQALAVHLHELLSAEQGILRSSGTKMMIVRILLSCGWLLYGLRANNALHHLVRSIFAWLNLDQSCVVEKWLDLYDLAARNLLDYGHSKQSTQILEQVVRFQEQTLVEEHPDRIASKNELARSYQLNGQLEECIALLEQVAKTQEQTLPEEHRGRLTSQCLLAGAYRENEQVKKAVAVLERVVKIQEYALSKEHPERLFSMSLLARAYRDDERVTDAIALLEHVSAIQEHTLPEEHLNRLACKRSLADAYEADKQVTKAIAILKQVLKIQEQTLSEEHQERLTSEHILAGLYQEDRQVEKALVLLEHVVKIEEQTLSDESPARLRSKHKLALLYRDVGQIEKAMAQIEQVVEIYAQILSEEHPQRQFAKQTLALIYRDVGQIEKAVAEIEEVVEVWEHKPVEEYPNRLSIECLAAEFLWDLGEREKSLLMMRRVSESQQKLLGKRHHQSVSSANLLRQMEGAMLQAENCQGRVVPR